MSTLAWIAAKNLQAARYERALKKIAKGRCYCGKYEHDGCAMDEAAIALGKKRTYTKGIVSERPMDWDG